MNGLGFTTPWLLAALPLLPALWWLLRITPPAARRQAFPALALLAGLTAAPAAAARTPWWLLALRMAAAGLVIIALAGPIRRAAHPHATSAPLLVVIDNGWAAAPDWPERLRAAAGAVQEAATPTTPVRLLLTARPADDTPPGLGPAIPAAELVAHLAVAAPQPWPPDRAAAAAALAAVPHPASLRVTYLSDGLATPGPGDAALRASLARFAQVTELRSTRPPRILRAALPHAEALALRAETLPGHPGPASARALSTDGATLADTPLAFAADGTGAGSLVLPPDLRNRVAALRLAGDASAASILLLDEAARHRPVGLPRRGGAADEPLTGSQYYLRRALADRAELHTDTIAGLLRGALSVIVLPDQPIADDPANPDAASLTAWVRAGGVLLRFAGPALAAATAPDPLLPVALLSGDRALGGAMSWSRPATLAAFPAASPFAGLPVPADVQITRQVLAQPGDAPDHPGRQDWASLADGTPLVTAAPLGAGWLVLFHVTANAEWSNLPLSGLFPDMLTRIIARSLGVTGAPVDGALTPVRVLDGAGQLGPPGPAARPLPAGALATTEPGPQHPPGLYAAAGATLAYNLGPSLAPLAPSLPTQGAAQRPFGRATADRAYGPALLAAALLLLIIDGLIALALRGLLPLRLALPLALLLALPAAAHADPPSLATHLAYIRTGDAQADGISEAGLTGLSDYVGARTSAVLAEPIGVDPAQDDLSVFPLLYWPVLADSPTPSGATLARLDDYMDDGGIIVFDTRDGTDAPAQAALRRIGTALDLPPLVPLTTAHVLSHAFYLLRDWPGRIAGAPVWIAQGENRSNDGVSPVILGANDWAAAWATDPSGGFPYAVEPGGEAQRVQAYRFGVNLVIYALTGNYKADQIHVPELLRRLGTEGP